jgi:FMNH2-dependent dimethyl sulfone monooxygenase
MSAATSELGIDFATRQCDAIFISAMRKGDQGSAEMAKAYGEMANNVHSAAAAHNRKVRVCAMCFVVMDETDEKAAETVRWLEDEIDVEAVTNQYRRLSGNISGVELNKEWLYAFGLGLSGNQIFGSYATVADRLTELYEAGIQQVALYFWDPRRSIERFAEHVMPLLRERGLRRD